MVVLLVTDFKEWTTIYKGKTFYNHIDDTSFLFKYQWIDIGRNRIASGNN